VRAWGSSNDSGQTTVPTGLTDAVAVAAGDNHSIALKRDGTVVGWGYNGFGQINGPAGARQCSGSRGGERIFPGPEEMMERSWRGAVMTPVRRPFRRDWPISWDCASDSYSLALRSDGSVVAWGNNGSGRRLSRLDWSTFSIAAGNSYALALRVTARLWLGASDSSAARPFPRE